MENCNVQGWQKMKGISPDERRRSELLKEEILKEIKLMGMIPFVRYMELALYHPQYGYYHSPLEKIGKKGDYYTSPHIHSVFGRLIGLQIEEMWKVSGLPASFNIFELGPGMGWLAHDILTEMEKGHPACFQSILYSMIETSPLLIQAQKKRLGHFVNMGKVIWLTPDDFPETEDETDCCFLSNEFFDALPCHTLVMKGGRLCEVYVDASGDSFVEVMGPLSTPWLGAYLNSQGIFLGEGQRAEINLNALKWLSDVVRYMRRGFVFTIDFGWKAEELYAPNRNDGTFLCYFRHGTSNDPYTMVGLQDMSAHVNFSALMVFGSRIGLKTVGFSPQYRFLLSLGLLNEMAALEEEIERTPPSPTKRALLQQKWAVRSFMIPNELGYGFKVLVQYKGTEDPHLKGFGSLPPLHWKGKRWI